MKDPKKELELTEPNLFSSFSEESPLAIEMRRLYSRMRQKVRGTSMKSFMLTSASMNEGKSTVSAHLAMTVARHKNTNTIVVDADLRKSTLHKYYGLERTPGFAECLAGEKSIKECTHDTPIETLKFMPAGRYESAPSYLFDTHRLGEVFSELKFYYDTVIVDCPPVIPVSDPVLLVPEMDGVLLVVMAGSTPRELVKRAQDVLRDVDANLLGCVVNNYSEVLPYYYGHKYYGYRESELPKPEDRETAPKKRQKTQAEPAPAGAPSPGGGSQSGVQSSRKPK